MAERIHLVDPNNGDVFTVDDSEAAVAQKKYGLVPADQKDISNYRYKQSSLSDKVSETIKVVPEETKRTFAGAVEATAGAIQGATGFGTAPGLDEESGRIRARQIAPEVYTDEALARRARHPGAAIAGQLPLQAPIAALSGGSSLVGQGAALLGRAALYGAASESNEAPIEGREFDVEKMAFDGTIAGVIDGATLGASKLFRGATGYFDDAAGKAVARGVQDAAGEGNAAIRAAKDAYYEGEIGAARKSFLESEAKKLEQEFVKREERMFSEKSVKAKVSGNLTAQQKEVFAQATALRDVADQMVASGVDETADFVTALRKASEDMGAQTTSAGMFRAARKAVKELSKGSPAMAEEVLQRLDESLGNKGTWGRIAETHAAERVVAADRVATVVNANVDPMTLRHRRLLQQADEMGLDGGLKGGNIRGEPMDTALEAVKKRALASGDPKLQKMGRRLEAAMDDLTAEEFYKHFPEAGPGVVAAARAVAPKVIDKATDAAVGAAAGPFARFVPDALKEGASKAARAVGRKVAPAVVASEDALKAAAKAPSKIAGAAMRGVSGLAADNLSDYVVKQGAAKAAQAAVGFGAAHAVSKLGERFLKAKSSDMLAGVLGGVVSGPVGGVVSGLGGMYVAKRLNPLLSPLLKKAIIATTKSKLGQEVLMRGGLALLGSQMFGPVGAVAGSLLGAKLVPSAARDVLLEVAVSAGRRVGTAARAMTNPKFIDAGINAARFTGPTISMGISRFLGDDDNLATAYQNKRENLTKLMNDPNLLIEEMNASFADLAEVSPELHEQMAMKTFQALSFVRSKIPATIGVSLTRRDGIPPSKFQMRQFALYYTAATDPSSVVEDLKNNRAAPEQMEALRAVWPGVYMELKGEILAALTESPVKPSFNQRMRMDTLFDFGKSLDTALSWDIALRAQEARAVQAKKNQARKGSKPRRSSQASIRSTQPAGIEALSNPQTV